MSVGSRSSSDVESLRRQYADRVSALDMQREVEYVPITT